MVSLGIAVAMNHYIKQQLIGPARTLQAIVEEYGGNPKSYRGNQLAYTKVRIKTYHTANRKILSHPINWGTQWIMEISSNE